MKVTIHAKNAAEVARKREEMLHRLGGDDFVIKAKVEDYPSPLKSVRQMEELMNGSGKKLMEAVESEVTGVLSERVPVQ